MRKVLAWTWLTFLVIIVVAFAVWVERVQPGALKHILAIGGAAGVLTAILVVTLNAIDQIWP